MEIAKWKSQQKIQKRVKSQNRKVGGIANETVNNFLSELYGTVDLMELHYCIFTKSDFLLSQFSKFPNFKFPN